MDGVRAIRITDRGVAEVEFEDRVESVQCDKFEAKEMAELSAVLDRIIMRAAHRRQSSGMTMDDYFQPIDLKRK